MDDEHDEDGVHFDDPKVQELYDQIMAQRRQIIRGLEGLWTLRKILEELVQRKGLSIELDPRTPERLRDILTIGAVTSGRWALAGAGIGLLASIFLKRRAACMAIGSAAGALAGGVHAYVAVKQGWRLRGYLDEHGVEHVEVIVKALPDSAAA